MKLKDILSNPQLKQLKPKQYTWKDKSMSNTQQQPPPPSRNTSGGHYDAYIEGKPRLKKYFGGSFTKSI